MNKNDELLKQMVWIIPQEKDNYFYEKQFGRRHKEGLDNYVRIENLNLSLNSEYDGMVKLASLGNCVVLNNGKTESGYIGVCTIPEILSDKQKQFFILFKEQIDKFCIFEINEIKRQNSIGNEIRKPIDIDTFYSNYIELAKSESRNINGK